jgi:hypothetical protein
MSWLLLAGALLSGCSTEPPRSKSTRHEEIQAYLQQHPEFAEPSAASSDSTELGVGR